MLQNIRDHAQGWLAWVIVGLISIPFALWGIHEYLSPSRNPAVATVNGEEITVQVFENRFQQEIRRLQTQFKGQNFDLTQFEGILKQQTLNQLINSSLMLQTALGAHLRISDSLLQLRIHQFPFFQENGQFSVERYHQLLAAQNLSPAAFEADIRQGLLSDQLRDAVLNSALVTSSELSAYQKLDQQQRLVSYVKVEPSRFADSVLVDDAELEAYFKEHAAEFMTPEQVSVEYVELQPDVLEITDVDETLLQQRYDEQRQSFTTSPEWQARHILISEKDKPEEAKAKAEEVLTKLKEGADFAELAKEFSDDTISAEQGGDLGWFSPGRMVAPFEEAVAGMKVGDVSELVKTQFGYHIIELTDLKPEAVKPFSEVKEQLAEAYRREAAESAFFTHLEEFSNLAFENQDSLAVLVQTLGLKKQETELFERSGVKNNELLSNPKVLEAAFGSQVLQERLNSEVLELAPQHVVVLRLKEHVEAKPKTLDMVQDDIRTKLLAEKQQKAAEDLAKTLLAELEKGADPIELLKEHDLSWNSPEWVGRRGNADVEPAIIRTAFQMGAVTQDKTLYKGQSLGEAYALIAVLDSKPGELKEDEAKSLQASLGQAWGESEYTLFLEHLKARSEIKIFQEHLKADDTQL